MAVGLVDHLHARSHHAGELEDRDTRGQRLGGEGVAQLIRPALLGSRRRRGPGTNRGSASYRGRCALPSSRERPAAYRDEAGRRSRAARARSLRGTRRREASGSGERCQTGHRHNDAGQRGRDRNGRDRGVRARSIRSSAARSPRRIQRAARTPDRARRRAHRPRAGRTAAVPRSAARGCFRPRRPGCWSYSASEWPRRILGVAPASAGSGWCR